MQTIKPGLLAQPRFSKTLGMGADLGGTTFKIGETQGFELLTKKTIEEPSKWNDGPEAFAETVVNAWSKLALESGRKLTDYRLFSVAVCGPTNSETGTILRITNRGGSAWRRRDFRSDIVAALVKRGLKAPNVVVANDGMFFNIGEWAMAVLDGRAAANSTFVTVCAGTGLAFGATLGGTPWKGHQGEGAEEGHRSCDPTVFCRLAKIDTEIAYPKCGCGNPGVCLEKTPACVEGLVALVQAEINAGKWPKGTEARKLALSLLNQANDGDKKAWTVIHKQMLFLGMILAELHRTYKSPIYCCPGAYSTRSRIKERCLNSIREGFRANQAFVDDNDPQITIVPGVCGENAAVYGGVLFAALKANLINVQN